MLLPKTRSFLSACLLLLSWTACQKSNYAEDHPPLNTADTCSSKATYASRIKKILDVSCAYSGCHDGTNQEPNLTQYSTASAAANKIKQRACIEKNMPAAAPLSDCDITRLRTWCETGTPQ